MTAQKDWQRLNNEIIACRKCPRLTEWREKVAMEKRRAYRDWTYWGKPVPGFGDIDARILVVGLAPGAHGSNRTGRMFTGDASGEFLYRALFNAGFSNQPVSQTNDDPLQLRKIYISAVCRCAPPGNKPTNEEIHNCIGYLEREFAMLYSLEGIVALGKVAFDTLTRIKFNGTQLHFSHGALFKPEGYPWLLSSYHPSRQNTQTGRLTIKMFADIWSSANRLLETKE
jgi:uracil-DNA glycosylase